MSVSVVGESWLEEDKLLRRSRVDGHRVVEVLLRGAHCDGHGDALHHLVDSLADAVGADDFKVREVMTIVFAVDLADEFEQAGLLVMLVSRGEEHVGEARGKHLDVIFAKFFDSSLSRESNGADRRVGEDNRSDVGVVDLES